MYYARLAANNVSHTSWPTDSAASPETLNAWFGIADDTLNSWKEVHDCFANLQGDNPLPRVSAHSAFTAFVVKALHQAIGYYPAKYPAEIIAFALLKVWIAHHQEELKNANLEIMGFEQGGLRQL